MATNLKPSDIEGLEKLKEQADQFVQDCFDWVGPLHETGLLGHLYDLRYKIDATIKEINDAKDL